MDPITALVIPAIVGIGIGILSGLLGIGGGTVMVPVFRLLFDMSAIMSTATSLFAIIPTSISGAVSHIRHKTCIPSLGLAAGIGGAVTSPLGVWLATLSPAWLIMVVAALDALLGAARAYFERSFSDKVFVISFISNVVTATLLVFLGNQLGVGSQLQTAVIVVLGIRIFSNVSAIRRFIFRG